MPTDGGGDPTAREMSLIESPALHRSYTSCRRPDGTLDDRSWPHATSDKSSMVLR
jgi:hypothetical protein